MEDGCALRIEQDSLAVENLPDRPAEYSAIKPNTFRWLKIIL